MRYPPTPQSLAPTVGGGLLMGTAVTLRGAACAVHLFFLMGKVEAREQFPWRTPSARNLLLKSLCRRTGVHVPDFQVVPRATRDRNSPGLRPRRQAAVQRWRPGEGASACALVALELACTHLRLEFGAAFKPVHMGQGHHAGAAIVVVALHRRSSEADPAAAWCLPRWTLAVGPNPGQAVVHAVVVVQVVQADGENSSRVPIPQA